MSIALQSINCFEIILFEAKLRLHQDSFLKTFFQFPLNFTFSVFFIMALKCTLNISSNVFSSWRYTRDVSYSFPLCVFRQSPSPEMFYPLHLYHLKSLPCLSSSSQYHLKTLVSPTSHLPGSHPLFFWSQYKVLTSLHLVNSHLFSVSLAPGEREVHKSEHNRKTDTNKSINQNKNEKQRNREIDKYLNRSISGYPPYWNVRERARFCFLCLFL